MIILLFCGHSIHFVSTVYPNIDFQTLYDRCGMKRPHKKGFSLNWNDCYLILLLPFHIKRSCDLVFGNFFDIAIVEPERQQLFGQGAGEQRHLKIDKKVEDARSHCDIEPLPQLVHSHNTVKQTNYKERRMKG